MAMCLPAMPQCQPCEWSTFKTEAQNVSMLVPKIKTSLHLHFEAFLSERRGRDPSYHRTPQCDSSLPPPRRKQYWGIFWCFMLIFYEYHRIKNSWCYSPYCLHMHTYPHNVLKSNLPRSMQHILIITFICISSKRSWEVTVWAISIKISILAT